MNTDIFNTISVAKLAERQMKEEKSARGYNNDRRI